MAAFAHSRNRVWRRAVITGLLALLAVLLAAPQAAASVTAPGAPSSAGVTAVAFSPDGTLLAGGYGDGTVRLWVVATGQLRGPVLRSGSGPLTGVAFSPDGTLVASAAADGTIRLWNPATGQPAGPALQTGSGVNGVAFSPDGALLASAGADGAVTLWKVATGQPGPALRLPGTQGGVTGVAFSPDG